ncbi:hypothetical protein LguiA_026088 [Lonicera macranthoides]
MRTALLSAIRSESQVVVVVVEITCARCLAKRGIVERVNERPLLVEKLPIKVFLKECKSPKYDYDTIRKATNNFSIANKIGKGGLGVVYKPNGHNTCKVILRQTRGPIILDDVERA